ncbi:MAG: O-antigen ligase family protein [Deltaproteobacteria bacterium]|nr:MAG: O-antigen ligase family protein [Deltaproteobacteria bacterium]
MPFVPDEISVATVSFVGLSALWAAVAIAVRLRRPRGSRPHTWIPLSVLYGSVLLSGPIALANGVPFAEWFRGAVPFVFLATYFLFPVLTPDDGVFVLRSIVLAVICWLLKALATALPDFISGTQARLTYVSQDFQLPLALIGITVTLFWGMRRRPVESVVLIAVLLAVIIATGYRSQAILVALLWVVYVARQPRRRRFGLTIASLAIAGALLGWLVSSPFGETYLARFEDLQDELRSQRAVETLYGYSKFSEAPILGKGLGFPVPLAVNQFGATEPVSVATSDHVGYLHNVWIYLCMDLGLLGLVAYFAFFAASIRTGLKSGASAGDATVAVSVTVATLLLYFTVEAAFREIQMNFLLGSLCAVLAKTERSTAQRVPAAGA